MTDKTMLRYVVRREGYETGEVLASFPTHASAAEYISILGAPTAGFIHFVQDTDFDTSTNPVMSEGRYGD